MKAIFTGIVLFAIWAPCALAQTPHVIECGGGDVSNVLQDAVMQLDITYIVLTAGECQISQTIKVTNKEGLRIEGEGRGSTVLKWVGSGDGPMFSIQNSTGVSVSKLGVCVQALHTLVSAFDLYNACHDSASQNYEYGPPSCWNYQAGDEPGSHGNVFEDLEIGMCQSKGSDLKNGIRVKLHPDYDPDDPGECGVDEEADCNNGQHAFTNVHVYGFRESGFVLEGQASTGNMFMACHCEGQWGSEEVDGEFNPDGYGDTCVRTGIDDTPYTSGSFVWYGGLAGGLADSVFVTGSNPDGIHLSGLNAERSRMLLRTVGGEENASSAIAIESVHFDTSWVHNWDSPVLGADVRSEEFEGMSEGEFSYPGISLGNPGLVVWVRNLGPLSMRDNFIARRVSVLPIFEPFDNISICWSPPEPTGDDNANIGGFVFEGNTITTTNTNPFYPTMELVPWGTASMGDCVYPTSQHSNLVATDRTADYLWPDWEPMPQHWSTLDSEDGPAHSVAWRHESHEFFEVEGRVESIQCLEDGVAGQIAVLLGRESQGGGTTVEDSLHQVFWPLLPACRDIKLGGATALELGLEDTLTLIKGPDEYWYQVGHSEN